MVRSGLVRVVFLLLDGSIQGMRMGSGDRKGVGGVLLMGGGVLGGLMGVVGCLSDREERGN